jgi:hypothetical protein
VSEIEPRRFTASFWLQVLCASCFLVAAICIWRYAESTNYFACPKNVPHRDLPSWCTGRRKGGGGYLAGLVLFAGVAFYLFVAILRGRPKVELDAMGMTVAHVFKTHHFRWIDVRTMVQLPHKRGVPYEVVLLKNGTEVTVPGLLADADDLPRLMRETWRKVVPFKADE